MWKKYHARPVYGAGIQTHDLLTLVVSHNHYTSAPAHLSYILLHESWSSHVFIMLVWFIGSSVTRSQNHVFNICPFIAINICPII